jgi:hypothetical protein
MSVQVAKRIPFHPLYCPNCQHHYAEINRCRAFTVESWPKPLLGTFSGESGEPCERFQPKTQTASTVGEANNDKSNMPASVSATASLPQPTRPTKLLAASEARIYCPKCKAENLPDQVRCAYCRANLLPGEGLVVRLVTFVLALLAAAFFGQMAYSLLSNPATPTLIFDDPVKPGLIAAALLVSGIWFLFRKTPRYGRYTNRADRHLALNLNQALVDYTRALEIAPEKERAEILSKRAAAYEKMGLQEEATRDRIAYTYEEGAYALGSSLTGFFGGDRESYTLSRSKSEQEQLLSEGRAVALGYCSRCKDAVELTNQQKCSLHPRARIQEPRLFVPSEIESGRKWILETRARKRFAWVKGAVRWTVILLFLWFALTILYREYFQPIDDSSQSLESPPAVVDPALEEVTEETFQGGGSSFAHPSDWEIVTPADRQALLSSSLKGLGDYEYLGGVYTGGVETCETCAHMVLVTIQAPEKGPLTPEQYDQVKTESQNQMGSRLLEHQMIEFNGVPAAVSKYIGLSRETQQWDVLLLVPGENRVLMFSCSAHRDSYERFEPVFMRAMDTLAFDFAQTGSITPTIQPMQTEVLPAVKAIAIVDRSGSSINVRAGAGTQFGIVGGLPRNSEVEVVGRNPDGDWLKIAEPPGWIFAELVSLSLPVESLPVIE